MVAVGDTHNFGRGVHVRGKRVHKPRTVLWEWLLLSGDSPLRKVLEQAAVKGGLGEDAFAFLPRLKFFGEPERRDGGEVERLSLSPLRATRKTKRTLAEIAGRLLALSAWLGVSDLHWENLALGVDAHRRIVFGPLDVEAILADMRLPTQTKLLPDADPEVAWVCRHACGMRRVLPYLGKPIGAESLLTLTFAYRETLELLDGHAREIASAIAHVRGFRDAPIRVVLRGTDEYVRARTQQVWPPLIDAEVEQMARGDIPYFFRLYGQLGIRHYVDRALRRAARIPVRGDRMLSVTRGLRSPFRKRLREQGMFAVLSAFDDASLDGKHRSGNFSVAFGARTLTVKLPSGEELSAPRHLRQFVASVYLPCTCGEVRTVLARG